MALKGPWIPRLYNNRHWFASKLFMAQCGASTGKLCLFFQLGPKKSLNHFPPKSLPFLHKHIELLQLVSAIPLSWKTTVLHSNIILGVCRPSIKNYEWLDHKKVNLDMYNFFYLIKIQQLLHNIFKTIGKVFLILPFLG